MKMDTERHRMVRWLNLNPDNLSTDDHEFIDRMLALRAAKGEEEVARRMAEMFNEPAPTLRDVVRELREIKALITKRGVETP